MWQSACKYYINKMVIMKLQKKKSINQINTYLITLWLWERQ